MINEIREELFRLRDVQYRDFQSRLIPGLAPESMIGVSTAYSSVRSGRKRPNRTLSALSVEKYRE